MGRTEIENTIKVLASSQGFYSRMWATMMNMRENEPERYDEVMAELEAQNFKDEVDLVLFLEC